MTQQTSPFLEAKYGWNYGENGWNTGMDENLLKFSFMFNRNVTAITASLPSAVNGQAYYLTTDNRFYFAVGSTYYSCPSPTWFVFQLLGTGQTYRFNGTALEETPTTQALATRLSAVEVTLSTLGTAAFEDIEFFATQANLDISESQSQAYTDLLKSNLSNNTDVTKGSKLVGYVAAGASTSPRTVQDKLRDVVSRADYTSDAAFNAAAVGKTSVDGSGNIASTVVPTGGVTAIALGDTARDAKLSLTGQFPVGARPVLRYGSATTVLFAAKTMPMGEFRYQAGYTGGRCRVLPMATGTASLTTGLGAESTKTFENWYAAFAVANAVDTTATIKVMPFLRVGSVAGSVVTLNKAGEGIHTVQAKTYAWNTTNNLAGCKCLVIGEGGLFSGRIATITANTGTTVTLDSVGTLAFGDFLLPAPPGYTEFGYMGSFYLDTAEVRNIYDTGHIVRSRGIYILSPSTAGSIASPLKLDSSGYVSPLATGATLDSTGTLSTTSLGLLAEYFAPDGSAHTVYTGIANKALTANQTYGNSGILIPFLYPGVFYYSNAGDSGIAASRVSSQMNINGYFEP